MKEKPRRSLWRGTRWFVLVGCSCIWVTLVAFTARDFLAYKDEAVPKEQSRQSFTSVLLKSKDCPNITTTNTTLQPNDDTTNEDEVRGLFDRWNDALQTGDPGAVADLYLSNGKNAMCADGKLKEKDSEAMLLLPTLSNEPRTNLDAVEDYFVDFLKRKPKGRIVSGKILIGADGSWAHDAGIYEFILENLPLQETQDAIGNEASQNINPYSKISNIPVVRARYSFLYLRDEQGEWKIAHHHSSLMPEI